MTDAASGRQTRLPALTIGIATHKWCELGGARDLFLALLSALVQHRGPHRLVLLVPPPNLDDLHQTTRAMATAARRLVPVPAPLLRAAQRVERLLRLRSLEPGSALIADRQRQAFSWLGEELLDQLEFIITDRETPAGITQTAKAHQIDVVLPTVHRLDLPFVSYLYDCQHRHHPENFTPEQIHARDVYFAKLLRQSKALVVNSQDTKDDLVTFFNADPTRVFALPFAPPLLLDWLDDRPELVQPYSLPDRYFLVSSQFWIHKSLQTVIEALADLHDQGATDIKLVFTGKMEDPRFPSYPDDIVRLSKTLGVADSVLFLGFIPKRDQVEMLKNCVAVVQPTLFEGGRGGGSVVDGVGLGAACIVSDIKINRELPEDADLVFFKARDHRDLANKMLARWQLPSRPRPSRSALLQRSAERTTAVSATLFQAIEQALDRVPAALPELKVSVILVTDNDPAAVDKSLSSVFAQHHPLVEVIVVDRGPDGSPDDAGKPANPRLRYLHCDGLGLYAAMNRGIESATGELVYFIAPGDQLADPRLLTDIATHFAQPRNRSLQLLYGDIHFVDGNGILLGSDKYGPAPFYRYLDDSPRYQACVYRRSGFAQYGPLDTRFTTRGHHEYNARLVVGNQLRAEYLERVFVNSRKPPISQKSDIADRVAAEKKRIASQYFGDHFRVIQRYIDARCDTRAD